MNHVRVSSFKRVQSPVEEKLALVLDKLEEFRLPDAQRQSVNAIKNKRGRYKIFCKQVNDLLTLLEIDESNQQLINHIRSLQQHFQQNFELALQIKASSGFESAYQIFEASHEKIEYCNGDVLKALISKTTSPEEEKKVRNNARLVDFKEKKSWKLEFEELSSFEDYDGWYDLKGFLEDLKTSNISFRKSDKKEIKKKFRDKYASAPNKYKGAINAWSRFAGLGGFFFEPDFDPLEKL